MDRCSGWISGRIEVDGSGGDGSILVQVPHTDTDSEFEFYIM